MSTDTVTPTTAAAVSAACRRLGFAPIGSGSRRAGLRVRQSLSGVFATFDLDEDTTAERQRTQQLADALTAQGFRLEVTDRGTGLYVTGRGPVLCGHRADVDPELDPAYCGLPRAHAGDHGSWEA